MRKYIVAAVLIGSFVAPAFAQPATGPWFVGLDTATGKCSVVSGTMPANMKMMGEFKTKEEADKAMAGMKECKA
jgi:hypothetical protein